MQRIRKAVIPAAGFGTRFLPATKAQPKEMLPIVDTPAIQYIVKEALDSGIEEILIITGRNKRAIEDHFDSSVELELLLQSQGKNKPLAMIKDLADIKVHFIRQKAPRGLGDAVLCAKAFIGDEPFAVLLGDDIIYTDKEKGEIPVSKQLIEEYNKLNGGSIIGVQKVEKENVSKYGIIKPGEKINDNTYEIVDFVEKPKVEEAPSVYAALGRYILEPEIFKYLKEEKPVNGEIQLTPAILKMAQNSKNKIYSFNFKGLRYDTGDKFGMFKANVEFGLRHPELKEKIKEYLKELKINL